MMKPGNPIPFVVRLENIPTGARPWVGGKALNLAVLIRAGLPVPPGFCVTLGAFEKFLAKSGRDSQLAELAGKLSTDQTGQAGEMSRSAHGWLSNMEIPREVAAAVRTAWEAQGREKTYAVRSSATAEDAEDGSFAGQFESVLNVRGWENLLEAIKRCWLSLYQERALSYCARRGLSAMNLGMAVVVEEMIPSDRAGVLFTAEPTTGNADRMILEWVAGTGEAVVQGTVCPARMVVEKKSGRVLEGGEDESVSADPTLKRLLNLARQTERLFGKPQDIEWVERKNELWLLQSRPITKSRPGWSRPGSGVWSNLNVVENLPYVATPMTWSILKYAIDLVEPLLRVGGLDLAKEPWLGLVGGRVYLNVGVVAKFFRAIPGLGMHQLSWVFGGHQDAVMEWLQETRGSPSPKVGALLRVVYYMVRISLWYGWHASWRSRTTFLNQLKRFVDCFDRLDVGGLTEERLYFHLNEIGERLPREISIPIFLGSGIVWPTLLRGACKIWFNDKEGALANQLLSRAGGMASADPALDLGRLAVWVSGQAAVREVVRRASGYAEAVPDLESSEPGREFLKRWSAFMARHGHHAHGEVDVAVPRWSERPDEIFAWLRHYLEHKAPADLVAVLDRRTEERDRVLADCCARVSHPFQGELLSLMVHRARAWMVFRENIKSESVRLLAGLRRLLLGLGRRWTDRGILEKPEDIFFLVLDELEPVLKGAAPFDVRQIVQQRRQEYRWNQAITPPPVIVGSFDSTQATAKPGESGRRELKGLPVSHGVVIGPVRVLLRPDNKEPVLPGEILVAPFTDPGWTPFFLAAAGLVTDVGGQLSHGSVIAREYGLPAVVNVPDATKILRTGQIIRLDANHGIVTVLSPDFPVRNPG